MPAPSRSLCNSAWLLLRTCRGGCAIVISLLLVGLAVFAAPKESWAGEAVRFTSAAIPPTPLRERIAASQGSKAEPIAGIELVGELSRPPGNGPFPALVMLHDCLGPNPAADKVRVERYLSWGYVVLAFDGNAPHGAKQMCMPTGTPIADGVIDALGALEFLAGQPFVDPARIVAVGFDVGGGAAISAVNLDEAEGLVTHHFGAVVAYYPSWCPVAETRLSAPVLIFLGEHDDWSPAKYCRDDVAGRAPGVTKAELIVYPGVEHGFDRNDLAGRPSALYGRHLAYDAAADQAAATAMRIYLDRVLKP
jgi:dienelactone hydrolase